MYSSPSKEHYSDDDLPNEETSQENEKELLSDVNEALSKIVSSRNEQHTLSEPQLNSLRKLDLRVRFSLKERQKAAQRGFRRAITGDENRRVRDVARSSLKKTSVVVKKRVRKVVTGDSEQPLREWVKQANVVKTMDKFSFVLGITVLCATEFVVLRYPQHFGMYYVVLMSYMMALRSYMYTKQRLEYFLLDFCYLSNLNCFASVLLFQDNARLWRLNFCVSNGPLLAAILAWRNSLVFHSLDKVTSIAIHLLPSLLTYVERWSEDSVMCSEDNPCTLRAFMTTLVDTMALYAVWQILYIIKTEILDRKLFQADPSIQTSLRWLTRDTKNAMHKFVKKVCRSMGVLGPTENFDPEAFKTKLVFWIGQFIFTILTLLPTPFLFVSYNANTGYILMVLSAAVYNGSNYYFEIFAARYIQQLEAQEKKRREVKEQIIKEE